MMFRTLIKGKEGNVILEITDTTGSHQFPAMRRLSVVRGEWLSTILSLLQRKIFDLIISDI